MVSECIILMENDGFFFCLSFFLETCFVWVKLRHLVYWYDISALYQNPKQPLIPLLDAFTGILFFCHLVTFHCERKFLVLGKKILKTQCCRVCWDKLRECQICYSLCLILFILKFGSIGQLVSNLSWQVDQLKHTYDFWSDWFGEKSGMCRRLVNWGKNWMRIFLSAQNLWYRYGEGSSTWPSKWIFYWYAPVTTHFCLASWWTAWSPINLLIMASLLGCLKWF